MKQTMDCTMGRIEKSKFLIKPSCKNQKFTCAHIFWDFMLNQVRQGLMTYESLMASVKGLSPSNEACGTGGGSGGKAVYGYTGTSPPESNKPFWYKSFLSFAATFLLGFMLLFVACQSEQIGTDPTDRTATVWVRGNSNVMFDESAAKDSLNQIQDLKKLYALADGWWHHHDPETARAVMAWLADKMREVEAESHRVFGKNLIDGNGSVINPRAIDPEVQEYLESLGFKIQLYGDDPCEAERAAVEVGAQDSCAHTHYTRSLIYPALNEPATCSGQYWRTFNLDDIQRETFRDSVYRHIWVIDNLCRSPPVEGPIKPAYNPENMEIFYEACTVYVYQVIPDMEEKRAALKECEDENSGINFPQMKSGTFQMQNREGILDGRRKMLKRVVSG